MGTIKKNKKETIMKKGMIYQSPMVEIYQVTMEKGIAQTMVAVSAKVTVNDWVDEDTVVGADPVTQGGDIFLFD